MKIEYKFNKWEYEIIDNSPKYGFSYIIYKNDRQVYSNGAFPSEVSAFIQLKEYIIESEFNIDLESYGI